MNFKKLQRKLEIAMAVGFALLLAPVCHAAAQGTNGADFTSFQLIGQRNIFDPNRMPRSGPRPAPKVVDSFAFVGTMTYAKGTFAFFNGNNADFRKVLKIDGDIAGYKVTGITSKSVSLQSGTNEVVLRMGMQMRRGDDGRWMPSAEPASYASLGTSSGGYDSGMNNSAAGASSSALSTISSGPVSDALKRLMERRTQQEQQLGQGQ